MLDRIQGMFMGVFLGDALGAPHEFKSGVRLEYTGKLEHVTVMNTRFKGNKYLEVGQFTDDSEMTLSLLRSLINQQIYDTSSVISSYIHWANSGGWMMGKNTRMLFHGIKTQRGYQSRYQKMITSGNISQSNGSLMRASPLALLKDEKFILQDVDLTNPNPINRDCGLVYVLGLRLALQGLDRKTIFEHMKEKTQTDDVRNLFLEVEKGNIRDIKTNKGWCLHALWCTLYVLYYNFSYSESMNWIISKHPGSDTDTNACIAGALIGAIEGFQNLYLFQKDNIDLIIGRDSSSGPTPRPSHYSICDFYTLMEQAYELYCK